MKEIERMLGRNEIKHDGNPVARWCFGNTVVFIDGNENKKPMKNKSHERIDLTLALIDAMAIAMKFENTKVVCPYSKERGILIL
jgi:phage terminase large subunit-like protein